MKIEDIADVGLAKTEIGDIFSYDTHILFIREDGKVRWVNLELNITGLSPDLKTAKEDIDIGMRNEFAKLEGILRDRKGIQQFAEKVGSGCPEKYWILYRQAAFISALANGAANSGVNLLKHSVRASGAENA